MHLSHQRNRIFPPQKEEAFRVSHAQRAPGHASEIQEANVNSIFGFLRSGLAILFRKPTGSSQDIKEEAVSKTNGGQGRFMVLQHLGRTGRGGNERPGVHSLIFCLVGRKNRRVLCLSGCAPSVSFLEDGSLYYETTLKHFYA
jgi:hypothetical protein